MNRSADPRKQLQWRLELALAGGGFINSQHWEQEGEGAAQFIGIYPARFDERYKEEISIDEYTFAFLDDVWLVVAEDDGFVAASALRMKQVDAVMVARQQFEEDNPDPELDEAGKLARLTELRAFLRECQDPNPPKTSKPYWKEQCNSHNIKYCGAPQGKKKDWKDGNGVRIPTKIITFQTLACSSTERCMMEMMDLDAPGDAEDTSVPVVHYTAKVIADQRARDLARFAHTAVAFCAELSAAPDLLIQLHRYRRR